MPTIKCFKKSVYGNVLVYFAKENEKERDAFLRLTGRKTITESDIAALKVLGFKFEEVLPE